MSYTPDADRDRLLLKVDRHREDLALIRSAHLGALLLIYDGVVDGENDFLAFQNGILFQGGPLGGAGQASELGSVPEPATLTLLVLGAAARVARRRRSAR
jgi:hypothetical protein